jgi:nucleoside 2-deoxyribosyltransferase
MKHDIFLICPVRNADEEQKKKIEEYLSQRKLEGRTVYYPARDTDQRDNVGYLICQDNTKAIKEASEVHIFYDPKSQGSLFDLGVAFALNKPLTIINCDDLEITSGKSFTNMIQYWSGRRQTWK